MYPYNRNTNIYNKPTNAPTLEVRENDTDTKKETKDIKMNKENKDYKGLSSDKRLLELLCIAADEIADKEDFYKSLMQFEAVSEDAEMIRNMHLDEMKHRKQLQEIFYLLTGNRRMPREGKERQMTKRPQPAYKKNLPSALRSAFLDNLEDTDFFRDLLLIMPIGELWNNMFEIFTDKQDHSTRLNYLFSKYNK